MLYRDSKTKQLQGLLASTRLMQFAVFLQSKCLVSPFSIRRTEAERGRNGTISCFPEEPRRGFELPLYERDCSREDVAVLKDFLGLAHEREVLRLNSVMV